LIDDALNCLFNAFDVDRTGRISYKKLCTGLALLSEGGSTSGTPTLGGPSFGGAPGGSAQQALEQKLVAQVKKQAQNTSMEQYKSNASELRAKKEEPVTVTKKRQTKQDREKLTAKSGLSVMERQNKLRAEAAKKKKEEAA